MSYSTLPAHHISYMEGEKYSEILKYFLGAFEWIFHGNPNCSDVVMMGI